MAGKKFKFRIDANRCVGIKEVNVKSSTIRGLRYSITVGLDSNLNLLHGSIFENNILIPLVSKVPKKFDKQPIYYPIDKISYLATINLQYNKNKKLIEKSLIIYTLSGLCSEDEIYCTRITGCMSIEEKKHITDKICEYATHKVAV